MLKIFLLVFSFLVSWPSVAQGPIVVPQIGVALDFGQDSLLGAYQYHCLTASTQKVLSPRNVSEAEFQVLLRTIKQFQVPLYACNLFIPGDLKVVGPTVDEAAVLDYVDAVLRRAQAAGLTLITWGSCGSRSVPAGFDPTIATAQFIHMAKRVATVAAKYDIILALENLNTTECNFINTLQQAHAVVKAVDHKNFRLCVDIYHMLKDNEPATSIVGTGPYAVYCEIAEKEGRTPPGVHGDDFTPYLKALKQEGYTGNIVIECRWDDFRAQGERALLALRGQVLAAYGVD
jgi:sugar phosphate isomerase/epimerase